MVIACWCQREAGVNGAPPLSSQEQEELNFLYEEWAHPFFISIQEFCRLMEVSQKADLYRYLTCCSPMPGALPTTHTCGDLSVCTCVHGGSCSW